MKERVRLPVGTPNRLVDTKMVFATPMSADRDKPGTAALPCDRTRSAISAQSFCFQALKTNSKNV
ncbi:hypothetical protein F7734_04955 [Scytonema sp. UIC 10036]|uniref:hypothetical protein n=1 Tax=Scytonema sp. UIC 10036 TaxID=2304196 RepID=UPI0012DAD9D3|nr:hypothetical protein [Scytonema sp. UIC 10036]MUG91855.1 hypothetical protein [Scytonema sp. UIC 10036]